MSDASELLEEVKTLRAEYALNPDLRYSDKEWSMLERFATAILNLEQAMQENEDEQ